MGIPDHLTCFLRNLLQDKKQQLETDMEKWTGWKAVHQACMLGLFNIHTENIVRNAGLNEAQAGLRIARRNISNFKYRDDTTLMAESEEELKSLLMKVKRGVKKLA